MPSVSRKQHAFMILSRTARGRAKLRSYGKKPAPQSVAEEFSSADKGKHFGKEKK